MIWSTNRRNSWKNFRLTPLFILGRHHVSYDNFAFYQLLCSVKKCPKVPSPKSGKLVNIIAATFQKEVVWTDFLRINTKKKYSGSFSTDGVSVSIRYLRDKKEKSLSTTPNFKNLKDSNDQVWVGIDPGMRLFLGGVRVIGDPYIKENITPIKYKSSKFHNDSGSRARNKKLKEWTTRHQRIESSRPADQSWTDYLKFSLQHMTELQNLYLKLHALSLILISDVLWQFQK